MIETLPAGTLLRGRYRIERVLGSGGFGHVYQAVDEQTNQKFAVKEYLVTGSSGKAQLDHEARVISQLHHPSMPAFRDAFDERGRYYIVLGYIEGSDLTDCLRMVRQKNEIIPIERILTWILSVCEVVTYLHNQNPPIIHRDIKPDNIRITPNGTAILVDLGNAKSAADGSRTLFFIRHQGTPGYAPLEQYPGGSGTDARSDVYALGGTLFFALTGHEPPSVSTRNTSISQGTPDLPSLQDMLAQNPPETSADPSALKQFRLGVTKPAKPTPRHSRHLAQLATLQPEQLNRLNSVIQRAMAMRPKDRYQTVAEMSSDLGTVLAAVTASKQPSSPPQGRPFDPHSTQPDLPFLYEAWQNSQGNAAKPGQPGQNPSNQPGQSSSPPAPPQDTILRCPNCQAEMPKTATFCPRCGSSLSSQSPRNSQVGSLASSPGSNATESSTSSKNIAAEPTMIYNPAQTPTLRRKSTSGVDRPVTQPYPGKPPDRPPVQAQSGLHKPFMQTIASPSRSASEIKVTQQTAQATPATQSRPPILDNAIPSKDVADRNTAQNILLYVIIAFVLVLLLIAILLLSHQGGH